MDPKKQKKVRAFLRRQHTELLAVKKKHIVAGVKAVRKHKAVLAKKIDDWSSDGKFQLEHTKTAKTWAGATAAALAISTRDAMSDASSDAADLADEHLDQFSDMAGDLFDTDGFDLGDSEYEEDDARLDDLAKSYAGNSSRGVYASLMKVATAVVGGMALSDLADSIGSDSADPDDIADSIFAPIETRTEMYIRTETGNAYSDQMHGVASADTALKKRFATIDPGCDEICHPTDGQVRDMDDMFDMGDDSMVDFPPAHPNCFVPGTMISTPSGIKPIEELAIGDDVIGGVSGKPRRVSCVHVNDHAGSVIVIESEKGTITLTDNHPVLTSAGWVAAGELDKGDRIAAYVRSEFSTGVYSLSREPDNRPTSGRDRVVFGGISERVDGGSMPSAWVYFHGDVKRWDANIKAKHSEVILRNGVDSGRMENASESVLYSGGLANGLPALTSKNEFRGVSRLPSDGIVGGGGLSTPLVGRHLGRPVKSSGTSVAPRHSGPAESSADGRSGYAKSPGDFENRKTLDPVESINLRGIDIELVHILNVSRARYSGKVFNLSVEEDRSYVAGGIVVHNCDCTWIPWQDEFGSMKSTDDVVDEDIAA